MTTLCVVHLLCALERGPNPGYLAPKGTRLCTRTVWEVCLVQTPESPVTLALAGLFLSPAPQTNPTSPRGSSEGVEGGLVEGTRVWQDGFGKKEGWNLRLRTPSCWRVSGAAP